MRRIAVIGATGSGKTTLAERLSRDLRLPATDLDELHWLPGWKMREREDFFRLVRTAAEQPAWVISGNYGEARHLIWTRADTVLWLDYPFFLVFFRLLRRSFARIRDKRRICNGNVETLGKFFSRDSILVWLFQSFWRRRRAFAAVLDNPAGYPNITFVRLRSPKETQKWLERISSPP